MAIRIVRFGSEREPGEGLRIGTVRRPPRGVPKSEIAARNFYDVWYPNLSPSAELMAFGKNATDPADWEKFVKSFRKEMSGNDSARTLDLLAELSKTADFSIGCYCQDEERCHRSVLRRLLSERGAEIL
jgi:uncharacterized protein YeaO (DUF488 family)